MNEIQRFNIILFHFHLISELLFVQIMNILLTEKKVFFFEEEYPSLKKNLNKYIMFNILKSNYQRQKYFWEQRKKSVFVLKNTPL